MWFSFPLDIDKSDQGRNEAENMFLMYGWESEHKCMWDFWSNGFYKVQFLFCHLPLPDMATHPPVKYF